MTLTILSKKAGMHKMHVKPIFHKTDKSNPVLAVYGKKSWIFNWFDPQERLTNQSDTK